MVSPSVTYMPNRPSRITTGLPVSGWSDLADRALRRCAVALRLGEDLLGLFDGDRQELVLGLDRPAVGALLDVRPEAPIRCGDLATIGGVDTDHVGQRQQGNRVVEGHGLGLIVLNSDDERGLPSWSSGLTIVTYGPTSVAFHRDDLADLRVMLSSRSDAGASTSSIARSTVSSSGAKSYNT